MKIAIVLNYWHFECEKASSRFRSLADMLVSSGDEVTVITSNFRHANKTQRRFSSSFLSSFPYRVILLQETGYKRNVSLKRVLSHRRFARNVLKTLKRERFDLIYCPIPSLSLGKAVGKYCHRLGIPFIIDVQDLWPEAFRMFSHLPFFIMRAQANSIYRMADGVVAVSETYLQRALQCKPQGFSKAAAVYIGEDFELVQRFTNQNPSKCPVSDKWITYCGSLGGSYDIPIVLRGIYELQKRGHQNIVFQVMGQGPRLEEFKQLSQSLHVNTVFWGQLPYEKMLEILGSSFCSVNPISSKSVSSIINKVGDYICSGIPVLNSQNSPEFRSLVSQFELGYNFDSPEGFADAFEKMENNPSRYQDMKQHCLSLGKAKFDRQVSYRQIIGLIHSFKKEAVHG
jgi:glycosyltransferase involved in cell wall biosynthesis